MGAPDLNRRLHIKSSTVDDLDPIAGPTNVLKSGYGASHPMVKRSGRIPVAFQVTSPFDRQLALMPHSLVMHVNPANLNESHSKKKETIQTRGGFVEQHWGDELDEISASGSTGAFINIYTGLSSVMRQRSIAWDRFRDLYDLYRNNGSVYDPFGNIVLQGNIALMYDMGVYIGYFKSFDYEETDASPFAFTLNWSFKVQERIMSVDGGQNVRHAPMTSWQRRNLTGAPAEQLATSAAPTVQQPSPSVAPPPRTHGTDILPR